MSARREVAARFDRAATAYDDSAVPRWLAEQVAHFSEPAGVVLDVATGTGLAIEAMIATGSRAAFVGVDVSPGMLHQARLKPSLARRTTFAIADGNQLPFKDNTFDLTVCVSALAYFADAVHALREWNRVTRDGRLIVTAWAHHGLTLPRLVRQAAAEARVPLFDPNAALGSEQKIEAAAAQAGLRVAHLRSAVHAEPLQDNDIGWRRVIGGEFGAPMRSASDQVQERAYARYLQLLAETIRDGGQNTSTVHIVQTRA